MNLPKIVTSYFSGGGAGGGGSSYGIAGASLVAGTGQAAGNNTDLDYTNFVGKGGDPSINNASNGYAVIYFGAAQIASITPTSGSHLGGTTVTLAGLGFVSGTTVTIAGLNCSSVTIASVNQLSCVTPATGSLGVADVVLKAPGAQTATLAGGFSYF